MQHDAYLLTITSQTFKSFTYFFTYSLSHCSTTLVNSMGPQTLPVQCFFLQCLLQCLTQTYGKSKQIVIFFACALIPSLIWVFIFSAQKLFLGWRGRVMEESISSSFPLYFKKMIYKLMPHRKQLITVLTQLKKNDLRSLQKNTVHDATLPRQMQRQIHSCRHCRFPS